MDLRSAQESFYASDGRVQDVCLGGGPGHACISTRVVRFVRIAGGNLMPCASTAQIYLVTDSILQKIRSCRFASQEK